jgi:uncharacterized repeat protein (TIGR01451 family)
LLIEKDDNGTSAASGQTVTYTVNTTNNGPSIAENVTIVDELPAGTIFVSASPTIFSQNDTHIIWPEVSSIAVGASENYTVTVLIEESFTGDKIINIANTTSDTKDNDLTNNGDDEETPVSKQKITIIKQVSGGNTLNFNFTSNIPNHESFSLDDDEDVIGGSPPPGDTDLNDNRTMSGLAVGDYSVKEVLDGVNSEFWQLAEVSCVVRDIESGEMKNNYNSTWIFNPIEDEVDITLGADEEVECTFVNINGFNQRTQGFFKTHTAITTHSFSSPLPSAEVIGFTNGTIIIGSSTTGQVIDNIKEVFGLYYASNSWQSDKKYSEIKSDGTQRNNTDQKYLLMIHQLLTAKLNCGLFGCAEAVEELINQCDYLYSMNNLTGLQNLENLYPGVYLGNATSCTGKLDEYNNWHGDSGLDPFNLTGIAPGASPSESRTLAEMQILDFEAPEFDDDIHSSDSEGLTGISRWDDVTPKTNPFEDLFP